MLETVQAYDVALPLIAIGLLLARAGAGLRTAGFVVFAVALCAGIVGGPPLVEALSAAPKGFDRIFLLGPISCVSAGLALLASDAVSVWLLLPAVAISAGAFGLTSTIYDPGSGDWRFSVAAAAVAIWLAGAMFLIGRLFRGAWFGIATRILASWLTAIGIFLGAAHIFPGKGPPPLPASDEAGPQALPGDAATPLPRALKDGGPDALP